MAAEADEVVVNTLSATGYPMRMLKSSPAVTERVKPMCESFGYALDGSGICGYKEWYYEQTG